MRWTIALTVAACVALPAAAIGQGTQPSSQSGQPTASDSTYQTPDTGATVKKHHHRHRRTSTGDVSADTTKNQTQSGMKNSSGSSTMGPRLKKVTPTQGQPVTAKGDTLRPATDTAGGAPPASNDGSMNPPANDSTTSKQQ